MVIRPRSSRTTQSVKVPPVSIPQKYCILTLSDAEV
jgi:hypothetical protein